MNGGLLQGRRLTTEVSVCAKYLDGEDLGIVLGRLESCHGPTTAESYGVVESHSFPWYGRSTGAECVPSRYRLINIERK